jgi:hypothetical protein
MDVFFTGFARASLVGAPYAIGVAEIQAWT